MQASSPQLREECKEASGGRRPEAAVSVSGDQVSRLGLWEAASLLCRPLYQGSEVIELVGKLKRSLDSTIHFFCTKGGGAQ